MIDPDILRHVTRLVSADHKRSIPAEHLAMKVTAVKPSQRVQQDVLQAPRDPVRVALDGVSDNTLVYIMALMLYGQADSSSGDARGSFEDAHLAAKQRFHSGGRARAVRYVQSRPLSHYLLAGIARMQRESGMQRPI